MVRKFIQSRGKTFYYKHWKESNINYIDDILKEDGNFKTDVEIFQKLKRTNNWLTEYMSIQKAIPKTWKEKLKLDNINIKVKKEIRPFLNINNKISYDIPNKSKGFYVLLKKQVSKKSHMPTCTFSYGKNTGPICFQTDLPGIYFTKKELSTPETKN